MDIKDYLNGKCIKNDVEIASKGDAIDLLISLQEKAGNINDKEKFKSAVLKRENEGETAIVPGIAIPHAKDSCVIRPALAKIGLKNPIDWDGKRVKNVFLLASPDDNSHINMLSALAGAIQNSGIDF